MREIKNYYIIVIKCDLFYGENGVSLRGLLLLVTLSSFAVVQFQLLDDSSAQRNFAEVEDRLLRLVLHFVVDAWSVEEQVHNHGLVVLAGDVTGRARGRIRDISRVEESSASLTELYFPPSSWRSAPAARDV